MTEQVKTEQPAAESAQLTITDLAAMKSIIDIASARGTFKPNEMVIVGQTYTKLTAFLDTVKQQSQAQQPQGETK